jgi:DnaK suppressor protein
MTGQQLENHRRRLQEMANQHKSDLSRLRSSALRASGGEASGGISNAPLHLADLATDNSEQDVAIGLLQNQQETLNAILTALDRMDAGTFGYCENCGAEIPQARLKAMTYASRCVTCEQLREQKGEDLSPNAEE